MANMENGATQAAAARNSEMSGLFAQALGIWGDTLRIGMKAQQEVIKFWSEAMGKASPVQAVAGEMVLTAERNADEYLRLLETSCRRNADLLKRVIRAHGNGEGTSIERQTRDWWDASVETARDNAQDLAGTNLRVAQSWTEVLERGAQQQKVASGK